MGKTYTKEFKLLLKKGRGHRGMKSSKVILNKKDKNKNKSEYFVDDSEISY